MAKEEKNNIDNSDENQSEFEKNHSDFGAIWNDFKNIMVGILEIRSDTDKNATIEDIKDSISMKGHTAWVLIFSILIASIGLNVSSPAVVIGAMLISPLMGPILGVGLSIAINDIDTLRRSFVNLGVMMGLSIATSFIFFTIPIFQDLTPEIKARTAPDVRDVFIAIAGGLALIMAFSRRTRQTNTIAGVAIATALMPPLCTAGYGLAVGDLSFFFGAIFLFTINTIFIALATFLIVKFLKFPMVKYINSEKRKRVAQIALFVAIVIFSFSVYKFYELYQKDKFKLSAKHLIQDMRSSGIHIFESTDENIDFDSNQITAIIYGNPLTPETIKHWKEQLEVYDLKGTKLNIEQSGGTDLQKKVDELTKLYSHNQEIINSRDQKIERREDIIKQLKNKIKKYERVPFIQISQEASIFDDGLTSLSYASLIKTNFYELDTINVFKASWYDSIPDVKEREARLERWLKTRLELEQVDVIKE